MWEGRLIFDFRGLQHKASFWSRFGSVLGRVLGAFWAILDGFEGFEKDSKFKAELEGEKKRESRNLGQVLAAGAMGSGREDLGQT